jgi:uncharacterized membrane protein
MSFRTLIIALAATLALAAPASAGCYADYKAKRDAPLQLHYGVAQVSDGACNPNAAAAEIQGRIAGDGWQLLTVLSVFDESGLEVRRESAGQFFLRY